MRATQNPADAQPPANLDYEMWTGPAPMRPYNSLVHPRSWRAFMEYGNGIMGDMCVHMLDMVRWMLDLGMPNRITSDRRHPRRQEEQGEHHRHADGDVRFRRILKSSGRTGRWGSTPDPKYPWGATIYGDKGTLKASVDELRLHSAGARARSRCTRTSPTSSSSIPEDETEKDLERHVAPAIRAHMKNFLECIESRGKPVADIEQGYMSAAACILANISMKLGRSLHWDHAKGVVVGDEEANKLLRRPYRVAVGASRSENCLTCRKDANVSSFDDALELSRSVRP